MYCRGRHGTVLLQKNDGDDAEAICTAARQPHVPPCSPRKPSNSRISRRCIQQAGRGWSITALPPLSQIRRLLLKIVSTPLPKASPRARRAVPQKMCRFGQSADSPGARGDRQSSSDLLQGPPWARSPVAQQEESGWLTAQAKPASASQRSKASARRPPQPWLPLLATSRDSRTVVVTWQGWDTSHGSFPAGIARS